MNTLRNLPYELRQIVENELNKNKKILCHLMNWDLLE